jgi:tetratricopeptide (TPR) repeat protein
MELSACFVTRNHAHCLPAALESLRGHVGEVVIADTGSTDDTLSIARAAGAIVVPVEWANDFAAVGNAAFRVASTPWILWMNPDEVLALPGPLATALRDTRRLAYTLRIQQQLTPDQPAYGTASYQWRLFQKHTEAQLRGRLHPHFHPDLPNLAAKLGQDVGQLETVIVRHAYHSQATPDKIRWTNRLIEAELQDRPDQLSLVIEWGCNHLLLGEERGHMILGEAAVKLQQALEAGATPGPGIGPLIEYLLTAPTNLIRGPITRTQAKKIAVTSYLRTPPIIWALAGEAYSQRDFATAGAYLKHLLDLGQTSEYDRTLSFDPSILGADALMNLGQCHLQLGQPHEAKECFEKLHAHPTHAPRAKELTIIATDLCQRK